MENENDTPFRDFRSGVARIRVVTAFLDWLFPARLAPRVTCRQCGAFGYKALMVHTLPYGWFCNEDERDEFAGE